MNFGINDESGWIGLYIPSDLKIALSRGGCTTQYIPPPKSVCIVITICNLNQKLKTPLQPSLHDAGYAKESLKNESVLVLPEIPGEKRIAYTIHEYLNHTTSSYHTISVSDIRKCNT